ncbi:peptidoglycan editing factor PgeF [Litorimonas sp. RW-G-Af-16]|uniref:peptidoglycan editing factor PgeF n=1 Tax=Litorimonas sp. RW-G-Af-16 TaxID=3241168 RepID=UPI00390C4FD6
MTLPFATHPLLDHPSLVHGFFGREGGVSSGAFESLNPGAGSADDPTKIQENRARIAAAIGAAPDHLLSLAQVHSDIVITVTDPDIGRVEADGMVTKIPGIALSALGADCGPILFADADAGVIGSCHAGWRGALGGIIESTIATMCEAGASPANIHAVLGPCISQPNYEVGDTFKAEFLDMSDDFTIFFRDNAKGIPHFDLPAFILSRLTACGLQHVAWTGACTYAEPERYFSYRRNTHVGIEGYGRNLSTIMLR